MDEVLKNDSVYLTSIDESLSGDECIPGTSVYIYGGRGYILGI